MAPFEQKIVALMLQTYRTMLVDVLTFEESIDGIPNGAGIISHLCCFYLMILHSSSALELTISVLYRFNTCAEPFQRLRLRKRPSSVAFHGRSMGFDPAVLVHSSPRLVFYLTYIWNVTGVSHVTERTSRRVDNLRTECSSSPHLTNHASNARWRLKQRQCVSWAMWIV
jgi:hypothetical protein